MLVKLTFEYVLALVHWSEDTDSSAFSSALSGETGTSSAPFSDFYQPRLVNSEPEPIETDSQRRHKSQRKFFSLPDLSGNIGFSLINTNK